MHPFNDKRDHKVQRARVSDITKACGGMASGGHADEAQDKAMVHKMVKKAALRATGGAVKARADRPARAWGGRTGKKGGKKKSGHTVNVIVGGSHPASAPTPLPLRPMVPGVAGGAPPPAPPPSMPPPGAGMAPPPPGPMGGPPGVPGMPPGVRPPGMPMRKRGGKVTADSAESPGIAKGGTKVTRFFPSNKQDTPNIGRDAIVTKATGGPISSSATGDMGVKLPGGSGGGKAKKFKAHRLAASGYGKQTVSASNPTRDPT